MRAYSLMVRFADTHLNEFLELGGAVWFTRREQMEQWNNIPVASGDTAVLLDRHAPNGDLEDTHCITSQTACALLGEPFGVLIEKARLKLQLEKLEAVLRRCGTASI